MQRVARSAKHFRYTLSRRSALISGARYSHYDANKNNSRARSASAKLFADAALEEAEAASRSKTSTRIPFLESQHENWDGEERIQDAVLRMLVDKYKPLRTGTVQSAEQKLKLSPPDVLMPSSPIINQSGRFTIPSTGSWATEPLLPSSPDHRPWHTEFKAPSHATSSIKEAYIPPLSVTPRSSRPPPVDDVARRKERETKKKADFAGRLTRAKESTLDYRLGIRNIGGRPNPTTLKGWTSLVEDRIQNARKAGLFKTVQGRGQPIRRTAESNPFIPPEEFLMNRIVQRNGAAPPWVEVQGELDKAIETFREILHQAWVRRAVRVLTTSNPPALLHTISLAEVKSLRDSGWEERERGYHDTALGEVNSLVRKYNGLAPYAVRRPYYVRSAEIERLYTECAEDILKALYDRGVAGGMLGDVESSSNGNTSMTPSGGRGSEVFIAKLGIVDVLRAWFVRLISALRLK